MNIKIAIKALLSLLFTSAAASTITFINQVLIGRNTEPAFFGDFNSSLLLTMTLASLAGFGIDGFILKKNGENKKSIESYIPSILIYVLLTTSLATAFYLLLFSLNIISNIHFIPLIPLNALSLLLVSYFQIKGKFQILGLYYVLQPLLRFAGLICILFILDAANNCFYEIYFLVSTMIIICIILYFLCIYKGKIFEISDFKYFRKVANESAPFGAAVIFHLIYFQTGVVFVNEIGGDHNAGIFSVAFTLICAAYIVPGVIYMKFLAPKLHQWSNHDTDKMKRVFQKGSGVMLSLGISVTILYFLISGWLVTTLFGEKYMEGVEALQMLSIAITFRYLASSPGSILVTKNMMSYKVKAMAVTSLIFLIMIVYSTYNFGYYGAIIATVISEMFLCVMFFYLVYKKMYGRETFLNWFKVGN